MKNFQMTSRETISLPDYSDLSEIGVRSRITPAYTSGNVGHDLLNQTSYLGYLPSGLLR